MQVPWRDVHTLKEKVASFRAWEAQSQRELDEWIEDTQGATLPAVEAFSEAFGAHRRELEEAAEAVEALESMATALEELAGAPERKPYIEPFDKVVSALEQRLFCDNRGDAHGLVVTTQNAAYELIAPAREAVTAEIRRRHHEAAEKEARELEEAERREAETRKHNALVQASSARTVLVRTLPEVSEALMPPSGAGA